MLYKRNFLKNFSKFTHKHKKQSSGGVLSKEKMFSNILQNSQKNIFAGVSFLIKLQAGNLKTFRSSHWRCFVTQGALKNFANFTISNNLCWSLFLIKLQFWGACSFIKEDSDTGAFL